VRAGLPSKKATRLAFIVGDEGWRSNVAHSDDELSWSGQAKLFEIVNHVHLIVVAKAVRDLQPGPSWRSEFRVKGALKAGDTREDFRRSTDLQLEASFELPQPERTQTC
jgi:hypothetical protein